MRFATYAADGAVRHVKGRLMSRRSIRVVVTIVQVWVISLESARLKERAKVRAKMVVKGKVLKEDSKGPSRDTVKDLENSARAKGRLRVRSRGYGTPTTRGSDIKGFVGIAGRSAINRRSAHKGSVRSWKKVARREKVIPSKLRVLGSGTCAEWKMGHQVLE